MTVMIAGIPETISRADYQRLIESVGFDLSDLQALTFGVNSITATVIARDENGHAFADGDKIATHEICIRVVKDEG